MPHPDSAYKIPFERLVHEYRKQYIGGILLEWLIGCEILSAFVLEVLLGAVCAFYENAKGLSLKFSRPCRQHTW